MIKFKNLKIKNYQAGFTLVETIAVVLIFSVMAVIVTAVWVRAVQIERKDFSAQVIQENILSVFGIMSKEIRISDITNQDNDCSGPPATNLTMTFNDPQGGSGPLTYSLNGSGIIQRTYAGVTYQISSNDVIFNSLGFCVLGSSNSPYGKDATRVTIIASVSNRTGIDIITVKVQTTVTSRNISGELQN